MQNDSLMMAETPMPFFLCSEVTILKTMQQRGILMNKNYCFEKATINATEMSPLHTLSSNEMTPCTNIGIAGEYLGFVKNADLSIGHVLDATSRSWQSLNAKRIDAFVKNKINVIPIKSKNKDGKGGVSGGGGIEFNWGPNGSEWNLYLKGEAHDSKGNYVEGKIEKNDKGEGTVNVQGGKKDEKTNKR